MAPRTGDGAADRRHNGTRPAAAGREEPMGGAPLVLALVGLVFPIGLLLLALLFDVVSTCWLVFRFWHDR